MVVAKTQGREKPIKIEQRKIRGPEQGPQVEQTAVLTSPIYIQQVQGEAKKTYKKRSQMAGGLSLSLSLPLFSLVFWVSMPSHLRDVFSFTF